MNSSLQNKRVKVFVPLMIAVICSVHGYAQQFNGDQLQVSEKVTALFTAISDYDTAAIRSYCSDDIVLLENGIIWNLDSLLLKVNEKKAMKLKRINTLDFISIDIRGNSAWVVYRNRADVTVNERSAFIIWMESVVLVKEEHQWKIKLLHSTMKERGG